MRKQSILIVFEGLDGAGKSTLAKWLANVLRRRGYKVRFHHEKIFVRESLGRDYRVLKKYFDLELNDCTFFLYLARTALFSKRLLEALEEPGVAFILDRSYESFVIYQSLERYELAPTSFYASLARKVVNEIKVEPFVTFFIDIHWKQSLENIKKRETLRSYYKERARLSWLKRVWLSYKRWYQQNKDFVVKIDYSNFKEMKRQILDCLRERGFL